MLAIMRGERQARDSREKARAIAFCWARVRQSSSYETVFVSTIGGHQAPLKSAAGFNVWTGRFLFCHLASPTGTDPRKKETCDRIYDGSTNHICKDDLLQNLCWDTADWVGNPTYECKAGSGSGLVGPKCRLPRNRA